ncbi:ABC transporter ATP-binding protein [Microbacterium alcoholitolerans]|uniref:ABC transporter ATP-binding protein n=1 Tax=unclassified Microbacterium TaxID=2609290 RepID=UPI003D162F65
MKDISIRDLTVTFGSGPEAVHALGPLDLDIRASEFLAIVGPSGCGKSTLLQVLAGLLKPSSGIAECGGDAITRPGPDRTVVFQKFALFPSMSVRRNVEYGLRVKRVPERDRSARVDEQLAAVGLSDFADSYPHQLSGGMQQRVAIARALIMRPEVLLLDEPFGALDAQTRTVMQEDLAALTVANQTTSLLITHSVEEAAYLADRIVVMSARPGRIKRIIDNPHAAQWRHDGVDEAMRHPEFAGVRDEAWRLVREEITVPGRRSPATNQKEGIQ